MWFIVAISVLVAAHEFGHFIVARKLGFKVLRFSIGFGRPLLSWRGGPPDHIQYWLSMIPLGGYVKMLDEHEGPVVSEERHRAFHQRPVWQRVAVLLAGPAFNFLFAILAYWLMFVTGVQALKPIVAGVEPDSVAARAGLQPGDEIEAIGGETTLTWESATLRILDELLDDGRIELTVRDPHGATRERRARRPRPRAGAHRAGGAVQRLGTHAGPGGRRRLRRSKARRPSGPGSSRRSRHPRQRRSRSRTGRQWVEFLQSRPGETVEITVLRGEREVARHGDAREHHGGRPDVRPHRRQRPESYDRAALRRPRVAAARRREDLGGDRVHASR